MVWFKVDDKFHSHPKRHKSSLAAIGLWTVTGSWCGDQEQGDGFIPSHMVPALGGTKREAAVLVAAGLWEIVEGGWRFHDWTDRNPSEEDITGKREATRERVRRVREATKAKRAGSADVTRYNDDSNADVARYNRDGNADVTPTRGNALVTPTPTRPDPTRTSVVPDGTTEKLNGLSHSHNDAYRNAGA